VIIMSIRTTVVKTAAALTLSAAAVGIVPINPASAAAGDPSQWGRAKAEASVAGDPSQWLSRKVNEYEGQHRKVNEYEGQHRKVNEYEGQH
jgi:hypothetical protein